MANTLTRWRPTGWGLLENFRREMDDLMARFFGEETATEGLMTWTPRVDVEETEKEIVIKADIPGVDPKNIEIAIENNVLTVRGERKEEREEKKKNYHRVERFMGSFYRAIPLPPGVDAEKVTATSSNGVITITVPKKPEAQPKRITVTAK